MPDRPSGEGRFDRLHGLRYRTVARLLHHFNLHHTQRSGPMDDGRYLHWCHWCGMRRMETPRWITEREMDAARVHGKPGLR